MATSDHLTAVAKVSWRRHLLTEYRWLGYLLPLVVFMLSAHLDTVFSYPATYLVRVLLTLCAVLFVLPVFRQFPIRVHPLSLAIGAAGAVMWIGLCELRFEAWLLEAVGLDSLVDYGVRTGFNPWMEFGETPELLYGFLAVRLVGLVLLIPLIEEFFLRGFVVRFAMETEWWKVPPGQINRWGWIAATVTPLLMHPATEALAVVAWFSMVTLWVMKTRSIWDSVTVHMVTNLLLGGYVIGTGTWYLM